MSTADSFNGQKFFRIVLSVVLIVAAVFGGVSLARYVNDPFFNAGNGHEATVEPDYVDGKVKFNVLLMGLDEGKTRTDSIMVINYNEEKNTISVMSVPRDTQVSYPGGGSGKINAAYGRSAKVTQADGTVTTEMGRERTTIQAVQELLGIPIHYYAVFTFEDFREVIDILGGVEYQVRPQGYDYEDPVQDLYIHIPGGLQVLNGEQAEGLVRFRDDYARADLERVEVQQDFLKELFKQKVNTKYIGKIPAIYKAVSENIRCNVSLDDAMKYGKKLMKVDFNDLNTFTMPSSPSGSGVRPNQAKLDELVETYFGYEGPIEGFSTATEE